MKVQKSNRRRNSFSVNADVFYNVYRPIVFKNNTNLCYRKHRHTWASEGGVRGAKASLDFEIISKKGCFFNFEG